jgi:hypothetical protein
MKIKERCACGTCNSGHQQYCMLIWMRGTTDTPLATLRDRPGRHRESLYLLLVVSCLAEISIGEHMYDASSMAIFMAIFILLTLDMTSCH